jgi:predicted Zn-dependent peptidase
MPCYSTIFKNGDIPDSKFDRKQLAIGTEIETEHTDNRDIAKMIAKAHLSERKDYYKVLQEVGL